MAFPSAPGLCRHRHIAANRVVYIVCRASPSADHASPSPTADHDVDGHSVAGYSPVYHELADPLADYVADHEVVVRVADHEVGYHVADHEVVDHTADHEIADRLVDNEVSDSDHKITDHPVDMRLLILLLMAELTMPVVIVV